MEEKACKHCRVIKPYSEFYREPRNKDGRLGRCKACQKLLPSNPVTNPDSRRRRQAYLREYNKANKEVNKNKQRAYYLKNKEQKMQYARDWEANNKDKKLKWRRLYRDKNREQINKYMREYRVRRRKTCPDFKATMALRNLINNTLRSSGRKKNAPSYSLLGYTVKELKDRLECQFSKGMSWSNHGEWHIDHKIPVAYFMSKGETRPNIVNALSNLQPLWASDNQSKNAKWDGAIKRQTTRRPLP